MAWHDTNHLFIQETLRLAEAISTDAGRQCDVDACARVIRAICPGVLVAKHLAVALVENRNAAVKDG